MSKYPILTHYVSEIDQFLKEFDEKHLTLSPSQLKEREKYQRIYFLRDCKNAQLNVAPSIWEGLE